jgi:hypothetical protein
MQERQRDKLREIIERAITVNGKLLEDEKAFLQSLASEKDTNLLEHSAEILNGLIRKEALYLSLAESILQKINKASQETATDL